MTIDNVYDIMMKRVCELHQFYDEELFPYKKYDWYSVPILPHLPPNLDSDRMRMLKSGFEYTSHFIEEAKKRDGLDDWGLSIEDKKYEVSLEDLREMNKLNYSGYRLLRDPYERITLAEYDSAIKFFNYTCNRIIKAKSRI